MESNEMLDAYKNAVGSNWNEDSKIAEDSIGILASQVFTGKVERVTWKVK